MLPVRLLAGALALAAALSGAERWRLQYFYDRDDSSLRLVDLKFPSARRGIAAGYIAEKGKVRPVVLTTSDGGERWEIRRISENPLSLFFLDDSVGWMVSEKGIWRTEEAGASWKKMAGLHGALRVHFLNDKRGWAVGAPKAVWQTTDGGAHWNDLQAAAEPKTTRDWTVYDTIQFLGTRIGMITGWSRPPRRDGLRRDLPDWVQPGRLQRELPGSLVVLETRDGGNTWRPAVSSVFGSISRVAFSSDGRGLGLMRFSGAFQYSSEVFLMHLGNGGSERVFRLKNRDITDIAIAPGGRGYLAGFEPPGSLPQMPVPGKLKVLTSDNLTDWREMAVDYRANARHAVLAVAPDGQAWIATDTGMILQLRPE